MTESTELNIEDLRFDENNANRSSEKGADMILNSLSDVGFARSVVIDKNNKLIAGNQTVTAALKTALKKVRVIETDGNEIIAVRRSDLDLETDERARRLSLFDNKSAVDSINFDPAVISQLVQDGTDLTDIFTPDELDELCSSLVDDVPDTEDEPTPDDDDPTTGDMQQYTLFIPSEKYQEFVNGMEQLIDRHSYDSASDLIVDLVKVAAKK